MEYVLAVAFALFTVSMVFLGNLKWRYDKLKETTENYASKLALLSLKRERTEEHIRSLNEKQKKSTERINMLTEKLARLEDYLEDRKAMDRRDEKLLSGINNIMNYDMGVAREAVRNLDESED